MTSALLALLSVFFANNVKGQCVPSGAISASIGLIEQPFPYSDLRPVLTLAEIDDLPDLPDPTDEIPQREHAYISTALADDLGFAPHDSSGNLSVNPDWREPNPQIRVRITNPATFSNWKEAFTFRNRSSNAVFTIVGVIEDSRKIVWVYDGLDGADVESDSGHYKLFAADSYTEDPVTLDRDRARLVAATADADHDDLLDSVTANVYCSPVSRSVFTTSTNVTTNHYTENDAHGGTFRETAVRKNDSRFALLVPHGGAIETKTSDQFSPFVATLEGSTYNIPVNSWRAEGQWNDDQTSKRWHITTTNTSEQSFPGLAWMLGQTWFDTTHAFRRTLALHGFTSDEADVIVGGGTDLNAKCHVAAKIKAETGMGPVAVRIYHDDQIIDILASDSHRVCRKGLDGDSERNVVNRLAADGGIQIEQSGDVRNSTTYRNGVANGAAKAMGELLNGTAPTNACSAYATPVDEDLVPNC
jgi:phage replication-related protein YjqB (UPF0714/DUF867 family)